VFVVDRRESENGDRVTAGGAEILARISLIDPFKKRRRDWKYSLGAYEEAQKPSREGALLPQSPAPVKKNSTRELVPM